MAKTVKIDPLVDLHVQVATVLSQALQDEVEKYNPKILEAAIRFLHNNGINAPPIEVQTPEQKTKTLTDTLDEMAKISKKFQDEDEEYLADVG